jgi:hypothetical protein
MKEQVDLMGELVKSSKREFVQEFAIAHSTPKTYMIIKETVEKQLTAINRDYGIVNYHNKGFIFDWGEIHSCGINWGKYRSSFNMDLPDNMVTVGGNYECNLGGPDIGIHINIYNRATKLQLPTVVDSKIMSICYYGDQQRQIREYSNRGLIHDVLQITKNMFDTNTKNDGLYGNGYFRFKHCSVCDDMILGNQGDLCKVCDEQAAV